MKKLLFLVAMLFIAGSSFAQYKPKAKSLSTEVQFNPFDQNGAFKLDGLKVRYFITDKDAIRVKVGFNLSNDNHSHIADSQDDRLVGIWVYESSVREKIGDFNLNFGYERHFDVSQRVSLYVGGSLGFNRHFVSASAESKYIVYPRIQSLDEKEYHEQYFKADNGSNQYILDEPVLPGSSDRASWRFDAAVFTGIDFYVYKGLYIGAEFGLGLGSSKYSKVTILSEFTKDGVTNSKETVIDDNHRTTTIGFFIEPTLRLGWTF